MKKYFNILFVSFLFIFLFLNDISAQVAFSTGKMNVRVDEYGAIRIFTIDGIDTIQHINRASFLIAGNENEVMDYWNDVDPQVPTAIVAVPEYGDHEISGTYNNEYQGYPPDVLVEQHVYGWDNENFCLIKMILTNRESNTLPTIAGLDIIQYMDFTWEDDHIFYNLTDQLLEQFESHYVGIKILSEQTLSAQVFEWWAEYSDFDSSYYAWMTAGTFDTDTLITDADGGVGILAGESVDLQTNASRTVYMAIAAGNDEADMLSNMGVAVQKYYSITSVEVDHNSVPDGYVLEQNYPNPFNPSTAIKFGIPEASNVRLKIFNSLGEEVAELVNEYMDAGTYTYNFDASKLPSGIYVYTLQAGEQLISKKMTLIK